MKMPTKILPKPPVSDTQPKTAENFSERVAKSGSLGSLKLPKTTETTEIPYTAPQNSLIVIIYLL